MIICKKHKQECCYWHGYCCLLPTPTLLGKSDPRKVNGDRIFIGQVCFLLLNQQCQSSEGSSKYITNNNSQIKLTSSKQIFPVDRRLSLFLRARMADDFCEGSSLSAGRKLTHSSFKDHSHTVFRYMPHRIKL